MRFSKTVSIVNAHAEGEVGDVIVGGVVDVPGSSAFEKMEYLRDKADGLRRSILFEPRGSVCQAVNVLLPSTRPEADLAFVIMEATKYPVMSGSNAICVATVVLETGIRPMIEPETTLVLEAPGGLVEARCRCKDGKVQEVRLRMLPAFVLTTVQALDVQGVGRVDVDVAYGGIFYGIVSAEALGLRLAPESAADIVRAGIAIRAAVNEACRAEHPDDPRIRGIANVIVADGLEESHSGGKRTTTATVIGNGRLDRSPTGTGVTARVALLHQQGKLATGEEVEHRSIFGTSFRTRIVEETAISDRRAVVAEVAGQAWVTGFRQVLIDPTDPLAEGHTPGDVWLTAG